ncbi:putative Helix-turn-helix domain-containing protein [uncultured delta proteobacterium]|uniref:Putative Helix-turn-helix domain-containing protein n=1 Tax=uncultured delta proteobacterium TaxID=34034 RepID=A0A212JMQ2_9DELT|nr:putative Helix-turn-helix domain-containing protein [uncultured delta proteobacterium]
MDKDKQDRTPHPFGRAVAFYREQKGWKQYTLAKAAGRQASEVKRVEEARSSPKVETILWVATALGVHPCELFTKMLEFMVDDG